MSLMATMFFVACEQSSINDEVQSSTLSQESKLLDNESKTVSLLAADCNNPVSSSAVVNRVVGGSTGDYCDWTPTTKTIGSVNVQFEGIYGSGVRPTTSGWYVGVVDTSYECADGWSTIAAAIDVKNETSPNNVGSDPSCGSFIPQNVVGAIGSAYSLNFELGYYEYDSTTHAITITKKIVIWYDDALSSATAISDPTKTNGDITEAYLVEITAIVPTFGASVYGTVSYTYTQVL